VSRIASTFERLRAQRRRGLIPFVMGGDPSVDATASFLLGFAGAGADVLEIGVPFSDPIADGPVNQRAAQRALRSNVGVRDILSLVERVRPRVTQPIVLLTYYNPVLQYGLEAFCADAPAAGVDGVVVPDLPPEEGDPLRAAAAPRGLDTIFLAAPTSTDERLARVAAGSRGFIYCVSLTGVTGVRTSIAGDIGALVGRLKRHTALPVCVGFGVSTPEHARQVASVADGVIVGSAIVAIVEREGASAGATLDGFVRRLRAALDAAADAAAAPAR
jgi:tryptophan synthase alpha chain